jgi:hypothetical protein
VRLCSTPTDAPSTLRATPTAAVAQPATAAKLALTG